LAVFGLRGFCTWSRSPLGGQRDLLRQRFVDAVFSRRQLLTPAL